VVELIEALDRLRRHEFEARIVPAVDAMFKGMATSSSPEWQRAFGDMRTFVRSRENRLELQRFNPWFHALIRNTCSITRLAGSDKNQGGSYDTSGSDSGEQRPLATRRAYR